MHAVNLRTSLRRPSGGGLMWGLVGVAVVAAAYPPLAARTEQPLAVFVIPIFVAAALGSWRESVVVGAVSLAVAALEGSIPGDLSGAGLAARLAIIAVGGTAAAFVAREKERRQRTIDDALAHRVLVDSFQSSLVPVPVPPASVRVEVRYLPGDARLQLGGDFYDALRLPDGTLGYVIGDVCGHGAEAAALGAAMRSGWKTLAMHVPDDPAAWLQTLTTAFYGVRPRDMPVTLNTGRFDPATRTLTFVSAGHPWPVLLHEAVEVVEPVVGPPLGVVRQAAWCPTTIHVPPGAQVLLYTDGLTENPDADGRRRRAGEDELLELLRSAPGRRLDLDALLRHFGPEGYVDDVAVLVLSTAPAAVPAGSSDVAPVLAPHLEQGGRDLAE